MTTFNHIRAGIARRYLTVAQASRLCARYRRFLARGKNKNTVVTAIARELAAFIWAIGQAVEPAAA